MNLSIKLADKDKTIAREDTWVTGRRIRVVERQAICKVCKEESRHRAEIV